MATSSDPADRCPIFIHSLFRSGSTYLFKVFRRSAGYWCYQEPLHEAVIEANHNPDLLLAERNDELMVQLRHPSLESAYFKELHEVWPAWKDCLDQAVIYDAYFAPGNRDIGIAYWRVLAQAAKGRPVFQECRTSGRIGQIKEHIGGRHIYLWRNPWDQWWSYKANRYFDVVNQLIINAFEVPPPIEILRTSLGIKKHDVSTWATAYAFYWAIHLNSEESYLLFYMLWCLGQCEGMRYADLLMNIDRLSDSPVYRNEIQQALENAGIPGIDFSDCRVPQGRYLEQDRAFFEPLEERVHHWLLEGGWSPEQLGQVQVIRQQFAPASWEAPIASCAPADLTEQASRARQLARRHETQLADSVSTLTRQLADSEARAQQAEARASAAGSMAVRAEVKVQLAEAKVGQADIRASEANSRAARAEALVQQAAVRVAELESRLAGADFRACEAERQVSLLSLRAAGAEAREQDLLNSTSWKLMAPLRYLARPIFDSRNKTDQGRLSNPITVRRGFPAVAMRAWAGLESYQRLRLFILGTLSHFPVLDFKLRRMYEQTVIESQLPATNWVERGRNDQPTGTEMTDGISPSTWPSSESSLTKSFKPLPLGMNAAQRTPLEASLFDYLVRR